MENKNEILLSEFQVETPIIIIRNMPVVVDFDLALLYLVPVKVLNQAVKRNIERFPENFRFQINNNEKFELVTNCDRFKRQIFF